MERTRVCVCVCVYLGTNNLLQTTQYHFYSKTNQMHLSNLFYFGKTRYMFRTGFPSIIRSLRLYIQHQVYVIHVLWLLAT